MGSLEMEYSCKGSFLGNAFPEICKAGHDAVKKADWLTPRAGADIATGGLGCYQLRSAIFSNCLPIAGAVIVPGQ
jgi:hypothetical protein